MTVILYPDIKNTDNNIIWYDMIVYNFCNKNECIRMLCIKFWKMYTISNIFSPLSIKSSFPFPWVRRVLVTYKHSVYLKLLKLYLCYKLVIYLIIVKIIFSSNVIFITGSQQKECCFFIFLILLFIFILIVILIFRGRQEQWNLWQRRRW